MNSKKLSELTQTPISTIRYYEKIGLLTEPERKENNYRDYSEKYVTKLRFIHYLTQFGFTLAELKEFFDTARQHTLSKTYILTKLAERERAIQEQLKKLNALQTHFQAEREEYTITDELIETITDWII